MRQVDFDGTESYSEIQTVEGIAVKGDMKVSLNPTEGIINIQFNNFNIKNTTIQIYSVFGQLIFEHQQSLENVQIVPLTKTQELEAGTFFFDCA